MALYRIDVRLSGPARLPPGQILTKKWPVLHFGTVPTADLAAWRFELSGAVEQPYSLTWEALQGLPRQETACDIHCVTRWSRYDNVFEGVSVAALLARVRPRPSAHYALVHAEHGFITNLPIEDLDRSANLLALAYNGESLTPRWTTLGSGSRMAII